MITTESNPKMPPKRTKFPSAISWPPCCGGLVILLAEPSVRVECAGSIGTVASMLLAGVP
jgi:hypothetical protein